MTRTSNDVNVLDEKEAAKAMQIEDVAEGSGYDPAEMEPRMNMQTCLAFLVRTDSLLLLPLLSFILTHSRP
jgi:hypothetical protein